MSCLLGELTDDNGKKLLVNLDGIAYIKGREDALGSVVGSVIHFKTDNIIIYVKETLKDIADILYYLKSDDLYQAKEISRGEVS